MATMRTPVINVMLVKDVVIDNKEYMFILNSEITRKAKQSMAMNGNGLLSTKSYSYDKDSIIKVEQTNNKPMLSNNKHLIDNKTASNKDTNNFNKIDFNDPEIKQMFKAW